MRVLAKHWCNEANGTERTAPDGEIHAAWCSVHATPEPAQVRVLKARLARGQYGHDVAAGLRWLIEENERLRVHTGLVGEFE